MISYVKIKPTADKAKNWVKGVCTSDDTKPIDDIANGSKLLELDTGKKCVYDEGQTKWIEYGTGEDRSNKPKNVKTEVYEGLLSELLTFENIQKYGAALETGAIGIAENLTTTDERLAKTKMGMVYLPPEDDLDAGAFSFGIGTFGNAFANMIEMAPSYWNRIFNDQAEYEHYLEATFMEDLGICITVRLSTSKVLNRNGYYNDGTSGPPHIVYGDLLDSFGRFRFTFYYMDEGVEPSGGTKVTTETISGPLSTIFSDNGWDEAKFTQLAEDIRAGRASAHTTVTMGTNYFDAHLMVAGSNSSVETIVLVTAFAFTLDGFVLRIVWGFEGEAGIGGIMILYNPGTNTWDTVDDSTFAQMTGQSSYDLVITRIEEE